jgi:hypothetical protein
MKERFVDVVTADDPTDTFVTHPQEGGQQEELCPG